MDDERLTDGVDGAAAYTELKNKISQAHTILDELVFHKLNWNRPAKGSHLAAATFLAGNYDMIASQLEAAIEIIDSCELRYPCYECHGRGCRTCQDIGYVPKLLWDTRPEEFRDE